MEQKETPETWDALLEQLTSNTFKDKRLDVTCSFISDDVLKSVLKALVSNPTIETFDLSRNDHITLEGWKAVSESLPLCTKLKCLILQNVGLTNEKAKLFRTSLAANSTSLTSFHVPWNKTLGVKGTVEILESLLSNDTLLYLNVTGSIRCTNDGDEQTIGESVERLMYKNPATIRGLFLSSNGLGNTFSHYLARGLKRNRSLLALHLVCNTIGDEGVIEIADTLYDNHRLIDLDFKGNPITVQGVQALVRSLQYSHPFHRLDVRDIYFTEDEIRTILTSLQYNGGIQYFFVSCKSDQLGSDTTALLDQLVTNCNDSLSYLGIYEKGDSKKMKRERNREDPSLVPKVYVTQHRQRTILSWLLQHMSYPINNERST